MENNSEKVSLFKGIRALSPLLVFLLFYVCLSVFAGNFYSVPLSIAFVVASIWAVVITSGIKFAERIRVFSNAAANGDVIYMIWIFVLAGTFATLAKEIGATKATVEFTLSVLPSNFLMPGLFLASCFVSMAIGTSVGTVVALVPVAMGVAAQTGSSQPMFVALVVGGAFFGDNLSFISDTTIAATRTQGCNMRDKFRVNLWLTLPAAIVILGLYVAIGMNIEAVSPAMPHDWWLVCPYMLVILLAVMGINVLIVLLLGIVTAVVVGCYTQQFWMDMLSYMGNGVEGMGNLIVVTLLASGMLGLIRHNGGIRFLIYALSYGVKGKRGAQAAISVCVAVVNFCTANNTIAILTTGGLAREITQKYALDPKKTASLLDTCSCVAQSLIPYGAQVLMASSLSGSSPMQIIPYLYYPFALGLFVALSIIFRFPKRFS